MLVFFARKGRKTVQTAKSTAAAKLYGLGRRTIFSAEGSFGRLREAKEQRTDLRTRTYSCHYRTSLVKLPLLTVLSST